MAITSAAKMRGAVDAAIDYNMKREQTITFSHRDEAWLAANIRATRELFADAIGAPGTLVEDNYGSGRLLVRNVSRTEF